MKIDNQEFDRPTCGESADRAGLVVDVLLETFEKWDKAYGTARELHRLKRKSTTIFNEMVHSIAYERALAKAGIAKADVSHVITGGQIGATHNYKGGKRPNKVCQNKQFCSLASLSRPQSVNLEKCPGCGEPLALTQIPISNSHLRDKMGRHIVGVELNDGRCVWFDEPLSPTPWLEWEREAASESGSKA